MLWLLLFIELSYLRGHRSLFIYFFLATPVVQRCLETIAKKNKKKNTGVRPQLTENRQCRPNDLH